MEAMLPNFEAELRSALKQNDFSRINYLREAALDLLAQSPSSFSPECLDYLARACMKCRDATGLRTIANELPLENVPRNGNFSLNDMTHLLLVRGYISMQRRDFESAHCRFQSAVNLAAYFGDAGLQATARSYMAATR
jgi:hypothetical protein